MRAIRRFLFRLLARGALLEAYAEMEMEERVKFFVYVCPQKVGKLKEAYYKV